MSSHRLVLWIFALIAFTTAEAVSGPIKIHLQGTLTAPDGQPTFDGVYPVTVRLWNGGTEPIIKVDTVRINVVHGKFQTHIGPYAPLTREIFSTNKSLSFQFPGEVELSPRTPFTRMAASGEIYCSPVRLTSSGMPATDAGTRVKLGLIDHQDQSAVGILLSMSSKRLELLDAGRPGLVQKYSFDSLTSLDISARFRRHGQVGLLAGIAIGAVAGYAMGADEEDDLSMSKETKRAFDAFAGAILGGLTGYLVGNSVTTDRWQSLPLDRVRDRLRNGEDFIAGDKR